MLYYYSSTLKCFSRSLLSQLSLLEHSLFIELRGVPLAKNVNLFMAVKTKYNKIDQIIQGDLLHFFH